MIVYDSIINSLQFCNDFFVVPKIINYDANNNIGKTGTILNITLDKTKHLPEAGYFLS